MRLRSPSSALLWLPLALLAAVLAAVGLGPVADWTGTGPSSACADEEGDDGKGEEKGKDDGTEPGDDLGDKHVSFAEEVNKAIEEGVNWLWAKPKFFSERKNTFAHWGLVKGSRIYGGGDGPQYRHPAGPTALALYTLLKCGVDPKDHVIEKGFNWLREVHRITPEWDGVDGQGFSWRHTECASSYELSVMILALTAKYDAAKKTSATRKKKLRIRDKDDREWLFEMVDALIHRRGQPEESPTEDGKLGWRYNMPIVKKSGGNRNWTRGKHRSPPHANQDMSSTQLGALALASAQRFGVRVPAAVWQDIIKFTLDHQEKEGPEHKRHVPGYIPDRYGKKEFIDHARGFAYIKGSPDGSEGIATGSITGCGISNLLLAREMLAKDKKARKKFMESGELKIVDTAILDGLAWLDRNWSSFTNTRSKYGYHIYYLYCVERTMDLLGKRLIGKRLWYPEGAREILKRQKRLKVQIPNKRKGARSADGVYWETGSTHEPKDVLDTCFALLYLKRATKGLTPGGPVVTGGPGAPGDTR
jgi:hypothetical protein